MSERLHKVLAQHGIGSRREVERWIVEGRIQINGVVAKAGDRYETGDRVQLDGRDVGKRLDFSATPQVLAYHKPQGQPIERVSAVRSEEGEHPPETFAESAEERLPVQRGSRWLPINPMHPGDSGLLLFTNDGKLSYALTRQKKKIPTTYMVRVHVRGGAAAAPTLPTTLRLDDGTVEFTEVAVSNNAPEGESESGNVWYKVVMPRADKRAAVRALFVSHELTVSRMMQVAFGDIALTKEMPRARHVTLKPAQLASLYALAQLDAPVITPGFANKPKDKQAAAGAKHVGKAADATPEVSGRRAPRQRTELRRAPGGGSNRPSRPGGRGARRK